MVKQLGKSGKLQTVYWSLVSMVSAALNFCSACYGRHDLGQVFDDHEGCYGEIV